MLCTRTLCFLASNSLAGSACSVQRAACTGVPVRDLVFRAGGGSKGLMDVNSGSGELRCPGGHRKSRPWTLTMGVPAGCLHSVPHTLRALMTQAAVTL